MYTRSYDTDERVTSIPENYDGNAFLCEKTAIRTPENDIFEDKSRNDTTSECEASAKPQHTFSLLEKLPIKKLGTLLGFQKNVGNTGENLLSLGTEEILIIAIALYMFFSKDGDRECAIMLAILLFIK